MLSLDIPGLAPLRLEHLLLDFNGTLACDGQLLEGVAERLRELAGALSIHVVTADTHGSAARQLQGLPLEIVLLGPGAEDEAKLSALRRLGAGKTAAVGNGRNDRRMLRESALGIALLGPEGLCRDALDAAALLAPDVLVALDLLRRPLRLKATLRT
jgi:soluble P-type ATPase